MSNRPTTSIIRQYGDGELSAAQAADLDRFFHEHPEARASVDAQVALDRALRDRIGEVMGSAAAPAELRQRIQASLAQAPPSDVIGRVDGESVQVPAGSNDRRRITAKRGDRISFLAVAATLALIAGAVLFGIFGRTIDEVPVQPPVDLVAELATFAAKEHDQCTASSECLGQRAQFREQDRAEALLTDWLNAPLNVTDLDSLGYDFMGAGLCDMPLDAHAGHLVYRKRVPEGAQSPMASLFVFPNRRKCGAKVCGDMPCGKWFVAAEPDDRCRHTVMRSTDGRLVYLLVCCNGRDLEPIARQIAGNLNLHESTPALP